MIKGTQYSSICMYELLGVFLAKKVHKSATFVGYLSAYMELDIQHTCVHARTHTCTHRHTCTHTSLSQMSVNVNMVFN